MSGGVCAHARRSRGMREMGSMSVIVGRCKDSRAVSKDSLSTWRTSMVGVLSSRLGGRSPYRIHHSHGFCRCRPDRCESEGPGDLLLVDLPGGGVPGDAPAYERD